MFGRGHYVGKGEIFWGENNENNKGIRTMSCDEYDGNNKGICTMSCDEYVKRGRCQYSVMAMVGCCRSPKQNIQTRGKPSISSSCLLEPPKIILACYRMKLVAFGNALIVILRKHFHKCVYDLQLVRPFVHHSGIRTSTSTG